jgi:hypothetical protein
MSAYQATSERARRCAARCSTGDVSSQATPFRAAPERVSMSRACGRLLPLRSGASSAPRTASPQSPPCRRAHARLPPRAAASADDIPPFERAGACLPASSRPASAPSDATLAGSATPPPAQPARRAPCWLWASLTRCTAATARWRWQPRATAPPRCSLLTESQPSSGESLCALWLEARHTPCSQQRCLERMMHRETDCPCVSALA